tara:strand:+ start:3794 stop:4600 length:807 start_codon:yes stop_codon:yes gene_type:complete
MGLGGHLTWTAVASAIKKEKGVNSLPLENGRLCDYSEIFLNNPDFTIDPDDNSYRLNLSDPDCNYLADHGERVKFKTEKHIITNICENLKIKNFELKCHIYLTDDEIKKSHSVINKLPKKYIVIEPGSKLSWTQSRAYPFHKWQKIVNSLNNYNFVQIGAPNFEKLDNVTYLNGQLSFRESSEVIKNSELFISTEGGLGHLSNAVNKQSLLVYTSYQNPSMTAYPTTKVVDIALYRDKILGYKRHHLYKEEAEKHDESEITNAILELV